jgi:hypothetical protein
VSGVNEAVPVDFHGARGGSAALTWGQRDVHRGFRRYTPHAGFFNLRGAVRVPAGTTIPDIAGAVRWLVEEYESLRTTYPADDAGQTHQLVHRAGRLLLQIADLPPGELGPDAPLSGLGAEFRHEHELPLRVVIVRELGRPAWVVLEASHLSVDALGMSLVRQALRDRLTGTPRPVTSPYHPLDRARHESTPPAVAQSRQASTYLTRMLTIHRPPLFAAGANDGPPLRPKTRLSSPTLGAAVGSLSASHRVPSNCIYVALMGLFVSALSGRDRVLFSVVSSNRWMPGGASYAGTLNQYGLISLKVADVGWDALLRQAQAASLEGLANALYDVDELAARGVLEQLDRVDCVLNNNQRPGAPAEHCFGPSAVAVMPPIRRSPRGIKRTIQLSVGGTVSIPELSLSVDPVVFPDCDPGTLLLVVERAAVRMTGSDASVQRPTDLMAAALAEYGLSQRAVVGCPASGTTW